MTAGVQFESADHLDPLNKFLKHMDLVKLQRTSVKHGLGHGFAYPSSD